MESIAATAENPVPRPIVLFDGACPLCRREIAHYRRLEGASAVDWVDIADEPDRVAALGVTVENAMARFHVRDTQGHWQTGAWGFVTLWDHLPGYRVAAGLLRRLRLISLVDRAYTVFARRRLRQRCESGACTTRAGTRVQSEE